MVLTRVEKEAKEKLKDLFDRLDKNIDKKYWGYIQVDIKEIRDQLETVKKFGLISEQWEKGADEMLKKLERGAEAHNQGLCDSVFFTLEKKIRAADLIPA